MTSTEAALREAMARETQGLTVNFSMSDIRHRARRRSIIRSAGTGVALMTAVAAVAIPAVAVSTGSGTPNAGVGSGQTTSPSPSPTLEVKTPPTNPQDAFRTGAALRDGREMVLWLESGVLTVGGRDPHTGSVSKLDTDAMVHIDWIKPHPVFGFDYHLLPGPGQTEIVLSTVPRAVDRISVTRDGTSEDVPLVRFDDNTIYWVSGVPDGPQNIVPHLTAYDAHGAVLDQI
jgi:hypothetical protein